MISLEGLLPLEDNNQTPQKNKNIFLYPIHR
jgi:hypothetical protein